MPRPIRKKIKFDEDSVNDLLQEIYNDSHNIKAKINRLFLKWEILAKKDVDIAAFGDQIIKLIQAESKNQDQKITLLKYLKDVVFENRTIGGKKGDPETSEEITDDMRKDLIRMVNLKLMNESKN